MKNIQIIDGADNCMYDIYATTDDEFRAIFPDDTDIEFVEDFVARVGEERASEISRAMWERPREEKGRDRYPRHTVLWADTQASILPDEKGGGGGRAMGD